MNIRELAKLAQELAVYSKADDQYLDDLEQYTGAFGAWYRENQARLEEPGPLADEDEVRALLQHHEAVLRRAEELRKSSELDMGLFQKRAKGIMAYTDIWPKKISVAKKRKG